MLWLMMLVVFQTDIVGFANTNMAHLADSVSSLPACLSSSSSIRLRRVDSSWDSLRRAVSCETKTSISCIFRVECFHQCTDMSHCLVVARCCTAGSQLKSMSAHVACSAKMRMVVEILTWEDINRAFVVTTCVSLGIRPGSKTCHQHN